MTSTVFLREEVESILGYARSYIGGPAKVLFESRTSFSQFFLPFAIIYYDSHHLGNCSKGVSTIIFQPFLSAHVTSGLRQQSFSRVFSEKFSKVPLFGEDFVSRFEFYLSPSCQFFEPCCSATVFAKQRLASADF